MQNTINTVSATAIQQCCQHQVAKQMIQQSNMNCDVLQVDIDNMGMLRDIRNQEASSGGNSGRNSGVGNRKQSRQEWKENVGNKLGQSEQLRETHKYRYAGKQYLTNLQNIKLSSTPNISPPLSQLQSPKQLKQQQPTHKLQQRIQYLQKQKQKLLQRNTQYLQQNQQLTVKITLLKQQHRTKHTDDKIRAQQMSEQIRKLKQANKILGVKCKQLIKQNQRICSIHQQLQISANKQIAQLTAQLQQQQHTITHRQQQWQHKQQQPNYQQLKLTNQSQTITINTLQSALKVKQEQNQHILKQKKQEIDKIMGQIAAAKTQIARLSNQVNIIRIQLQYKNMEYQTLSNKLTSKDKQLQYLTQHNNQLNNQLQQQNKQLPQLHTTIQQQTTKITQLTQTITQKQKYIQNAGKQIQQLKHTHKIQSQTIIGELTKAHTKNIQQLNTKICNNQQQFKQKIAVLANQHIQLKSAMDKSSKISAEGTQALKERNNKLVIEKQELKMQIVKLKEINARANGQYEDSQHKYRETFKQLQQVYSKMRNYQEQAKNLEEQVKRGELTQRQLTKRNNVADEQLHRIDQNYLQNKRELQANIKFLTEQLAIWSQKYQTLTKQTTSLQSQLLNYKSMYQILIRKNQQTEKNMQHSLISKKSSEKDYKQLVRQLESCKIQMQIMRQQKERIEDSLNHQLQQRKQIIESLIKEKKMLYGGITANTIKDN